MSYSYVITIANSIIGVSILAMPFCFKECGILLASFLLIFAGIVVKVVCHFMLKSALIARRNNYEVLAFHTFGSSGKIAVETCMIGFMMGTCVAFFVVMGDLGPPLVSNITGIENNSKLRTAVIIFLGLFVALPLALLRNVESLAGICTASIMFYGLVLCHILFSASGKLIDAVFSEYIHFWRPSGVLQCLPIFFMALSCQPQVFEIYESLPNPNISTMYGVINNAVNLCTIVYICFGIFGYIAFFSKEIGGNILVEFQPSLLIELIKFGFVLSVAVSFPLVIFPCRTSLFSLLFKKANPLTSNDMQSEHIPKDKFQGITFLIVLTTLIIGILIPDIEFVLGIIGSTIGSVVTVIFPILIFLKLTTTNTTERVMAKFILVIGISVMIFGTYVNIFPMKEASKFVDSSRVLKPIEGPGDQHQPQVLDVKLKNDTILKSKNSSSKINKALMHKPSLSNETNKTSKLKTNNESLKRERKNLTISSSSSNKNSKVKEEKKDNLLKKKS